MFLSHQSIKVILADDPALIRTRVTTALGMAARSIVEESKRLHQQFRASLPRALSARETVRFLEKSTGLEELAHAIIVATAQMRALEVRIH